MFKFATMMKRSGIFCFFCLGIIQNVLAGHFMPPRPHFMPPRSALRSEVMAYTDFFLPIILIDLSVMGFRFMALTITDMHKQILI